jgi:hypothetical protein
MPFATHVSVCPRLPTSRKLPALLACRRATIGEPVLGSAGRVAAFFPVPFFTGLFGDGGSGGTLIDALPVGVDARGGAAPFGVEEREGALPVWVEGRGTNGLEDRGGLG